MKKNRILKRLLIVCSILVIAYIGCNTYMDYQLDKIFGAPHSKEELISNYIQKQQQILELKQYFNSIVPRNKKVEIEFEGDDELSRFGVTTIDTAGNIVYPIFLQWRLSTTSNIVDSVITTIGWTQATLKKLKNYLDKANCIEIESGEPAKIGYQRSGMGMYFYNVFDKPIPDSLLEDYNDSCTYILYDKKLVLEYGGGAIGSQCFPKN